MISAKIHDNNNDVFLNDQVNLHKGENRIKLSKRLEKAKDNEYYMDITGISEKTRLNLADNNLKDNHLTINNEEQEFDLALGIGYINKIDNKTILSLSVLYILIGISFFLDKEGFVVRDSNGLDLLRIFSAAQVLNCHILTELQLLEGNIFVINSYLNNFAIQTFFLMSGYLIWDRYDKFKDNKDYIINRFKRIYLDYICMILISIMYFSVLYKNTIPQDTSNLYWLRYIFCLNTTIPTRENFWVNLNATYTFPGFILFYILVIFYKKHLNKASKIRLAVILEVIIPILVFGIAVKYVTKKGWDIGILKNPIIFQCYFLYGTLINKKNNILVHIVFLASAIFCYKNNISYWPPLVISIVSFFAIKLFRNLNIKSKIIGQIIHFFSSISFDLYLVHPLILMIFSSRLDIMNIGLKYFVLMILSIMLAYSYHVIVNKVRKLI